MFEDELEMEKKEGGGYGALVIIFALVGVLVGGIGWVVYQNKLTLNKDQATSAITANLMVSAATHFKSGHVVPNVNDKPDGPNYRLLEKAGFLKLGKAKNGAVDVTVTAAGKDLFDSLKAIQKKETDGTVSYTVPLAQKKLVEVAEIKKLTPSRFQVQYTWKWEPNKLGDLFDVQGATVQGFNTRDRGVLIDKWGADYYHADSKKAATYVVKTDKGWGVASE